MLKRWAAWPPGIRWLAGIAAVVLAAAIVWALFVPLADLLARHDVGPAKPALLQTARDAARGRLLTLAAGLFAAGALVFTALNFNLSREGQVTDRYTKATEQLGSDKLDVRIGGIYALERIARDSARDHPTVMEVLTAFIREHSREPWPPPDTDRTDQERSTRPDVQAAVTVVGRRKAKCDDGLLDLSRTDLTGATLTDAKLSGAKLSEAILTGATFIHADLTEAILTGVDLYGADLSSADLTGAYMYGANLRGAVLTGATLTSAELRDADLTDVIMSHADLTNVILCDAGLTHATLNSANLVNADLRGANLSGANLNGADLTRAELRRANFTSALLRDAKLNSAILLGTELDEADLRGADLNGAALAGADFSGADLRHATLIGADLHGADLSGADLRGADLTNVKWPEEVLLPVGWAIVSGRLERTTQLSEVMTHYP